MAGIAGMLKSYEMDWHTDMDIDCIAGMISDYTSGYPYLVSALCKLMDEDVSQSDSFGLRASAWTRGKSPFYRLRNRL